MGRKKTKAIQVGSLTIGGGAPVTVQSMLNVPAHDIAGNVAQAVALEKAGCELIRVAIPDQEAVRLIDAIKNQVRVPVVADIHFDHRLALAAAEAGVDKIRINPGNIGGLDRVKAVADCCRTHKIPIRIGVNSGSVERSLLQKYGGPKPEALVESALTQAAQLEQFDFHDVVISIKSSDVPDTIQAYRLIAQATDYPLHLGVTETGTRRMGTVKSAIGLGTLLQEGIGDTLRVSLTDDPCEEVAVGVDILKTLGMRRGLRLVACPTCGRTNIDLIRLVQEAEKRLAGCEKDITVAIMGCVVNGPGEAREADIGIAGGKGEGLLFKKGKPCFKLPEAQLLDALAAEIEKL